jgi:hypothetical protein
MSFGAGGVIAATDDPGAVAGVRLILNVIELLVDKEAAVVRLRALFDEGQRVAAAIAELKQIEERLSDRERACAAREQKVTAAESRAEEKGRIAAAKLQKAEERMSEFEELRAELRKVA